ncbi:hypothetical protein N7541_009142 [Penicillium brevicompactum]|uniref:Uncharacterized protein n=1 Tax=Penicillium brevicompactum TaxID=5074 RepID=A0A9W9UNN6_PENBR|nr:hypothetical protein N7541_009142 [Penicillium brevicompactum]
MPSIRHQTEWTRRDQSLLDSVNAGYRRKEPDRRNPQATQYSSASVQFPSEWPVIRGKVNVNVSATKAEWTAVDIPSGEDPNAEAGEEYGIAEWNYIRMQFF